MKFDQLLQFAVKNEASDIHIQALSPPMMRITGQIRSVESPQLTNEDIEDFIASIMPGADSKNVEAAVFEGLDFSYEVPGLARFRCSAYRNLGNMGMVMRIIREEIPSFENLNLQTQFLLKKHRPLSLNYLTN